MDKKKRGANYSEEEKTMLLNIVQKYAVIIENKKTDQVTWKEKEKAWELVALDFNATGGHCRNTGSLRTCYENIKKNTRKTASENKVAIFKTGGGKATLKFDPYHDKIVAMTPGTVMPLQCNNDSDSGYNQLIATALEAPSEPANEFFVTSGGALAPVEPSHSSCLQVMTAPETLQQQSPEDEIDWSNYSVKMLRSDPHPSLKVKKICTSSLTASIRSPHVLIPSSPVSIQSPPVSIPSPPVSIPSPPVSIPSNTSAPSPRNGTPAAKKSMSRRRPATPKPPTSEVTQRFETLAAAKLELVNCKLEQFREDEERREETEERKKQYEQAEEARRIALFEVELKIKQQILEQETIKLKLLKKQLGSEG